MKILSLTFIFSLLVFFQAYAQEPNLTLTSSAFENNQSIPAKYTCSGQNVNPPLAINNIPAYTQSLVLVLHDPDAPVGDWLHWAVYDIPPQTKNIVENSIPGQEILNNANQYHYFGPCPPGSQTHQYLFDLYALDTKFNFNENGSLQGLMQKTQGHVLAKTQLIGVYKK